MFRGSAERHKHSSALKAVVVLGSSLDVAGQSEVWRFADVLGDVSGRVRSRFAGLAVDVIRVAGHLQPRLTKGSPGNEVGTGNHVKMRMPLVRHALSSVRRERSGRMELDFDDCIARRHVLFPQLALPQLPEGSNETIELIRQRCWRVLERERVELPLLSGALFEEVEHACGSLSLYSTSTDGADSQLAGVSLQEQAAGFRFLSNPGSSSAAFEPSDATPVRLHAGEKIEPKLTFSSAAPKSQKLLGLIERVGGDEEVYGDRRHARSPKDGFVEREGRVKAGWR